MGTLSSCLLESRIVFVFFFNPTSIYSAVLLVSHPSITTCTWLKTKQNKKQLLEENKQHFLEEKKKPSNYVASVQSTYVHTKGKGTAAKQNSYTCIYTYYFMTPTKKKRAKCL